MTEMHAVLDKTGDQPNTLQKEDTYKVREQLQLKVQAFEEEIKSLKGEIIGLKDELKTLKQEIEGDTKKRFTSPVNSDGLALLAKAESDLKNIGLLIKMLLIQTTTHDSMEDNKQSVHEDTKTFTPFHLLPSSTPLPPTHPSF